MSDLIDVQVQQMPVPDLHSIRNLLSNVFQLENIYLKNRDASDPNKLKFYVRASQTTYRLPTCWIFHLSGQFFKIQILIYNSSETDFLRAYTDRMKIQLASLSRMVNNFLMPNNSFIMDNQSGVLKLTYFSQWVSLFQLALNFRNIIDLIFKLFSLLIRFDELIIFLQCGSNLGHYVKKDQRPIIQLNIYKYLLNNTQNLRKQNRKALKNIFKIKNNLPIDIPPQQFNMVRALFIQNIVAYHQSEIGLQNANRMQVEPQSFRSHQKQIQKNEEGATSTIKNVSIFQTQKIVFGLKKIKKSTPKDSGETQMKSQQEKNQFDQFGGHSFIKKDYYKFLIVSSINFQTVNENLKKAQQENQYSGETKQLKGYLVQKKCKTDNQPSRNSFRNQVSALQYMKDMASPYIAKYYLQIQPTQKNKIYIKYYQKNLYTTIQNNALTLPIKTKLQIAYKIAKGLCFLYAKKICHRDFKPTNVVLDSSNCPKIIDFGSCSPHYKTTDFKVHDQRLLTTLDYNLRMTSFYPTEKQRILTPAKIRMLQKYKKFAEFEQHPLFDVYAFGKTLAFIFFNRRSMIPESIEYDPHRQIMENIIYLIEKCTNTDPDDRPGFGQITTFLGCLGEFTKNIVNPKSFQM